MSASNSWEYLPDLTSVHATCDECRCSLSVSVHPPAEITIYTRQGTKFARHIHKECPNRWCRKRFFYGYSIKDGKKIYETLAGKTFLMTSSETAFSLDLCYEVPGDGLQPLGSHQQPQCLSLSFLHILYFRKR